MWFLLKLYIFPFFTFWHFNNCYFKFVMKSKNVSFPKKKKQFKTQYYFTKINSSVRPSPVRNSWTSPDFCYFLSKLWAPLSSLSISYIKMYTYNLKITHFSKNALKHLSLEYEHVRLQIILMHSSKVVTLLSIIFICDLF